MEYEKVCSSCGVRLGKGDGMAFFKCPNCGEEEIGRCHNCRDQGITYTCTKCEFSGP